MNPPARIVQVLDIVRRQRSARWVRLPGGAPAHQLWRGLYPDGASLFLKEGKGLDREIGIYEAVRGRFLPRLIAADSDLGFLALEDLSDFGRPPPWTPEQQRLALRALDELSEVPPPPGLPPARLHAPRDGWRRVAGDPEPLLRLFMCTRRWLEGALETLQAAEAEAVLDGDALVHLDPRPHNLLLGPDRAVLLDWTFAARGAALVDRALFAASLVQDGGPRPEEILGHEPALAAAMSGWFASQAGRSDGDPVVRAFQFDMLTATLPWAARALALPDPLGGAGCFGGFGRSV